MNMGDSSQSLLGVKLLFRVFLEMYSNRKTTVILESGVLV